MKKHPRETSSVTSAQHDFQDLPGLVDDEGISYPQWAGSEEEYRIMKQEKKSKPSRSKSEASTVAAKPKGKRKGGATTALFEQGVEEGRT